MPLPAAVPIEGRRFCGDIFQKFFEGRCQQVRWPPSCEPVTVRPDALCLAASTVQAAAGQVTLAYEVVIAKPARGSRCCS